MEWTSNLDKLADCYQLLRRLDQRAFFGDMPTRWPERLETTTISNHGPSSSITMAGIAANQEYEIKCLNYLI